VSSGVPYLFVPLATRAAVDNAYLRADAYERFQGAIKGGRDRRLRVFVGAGERQGGGVQPHVRSDFGIPEDPATGSAGGPLGCYLVRHNVIAAQKAASILNLQGVKMGRPATFTSRWGSMAIRSRASGSAVKQFWRRGSTFRKVRNQNVEVQTQGDEV
jgi:trans-2,3-dihydro-3-hydroxyanthranilate isomerase